MAPPGFSELNVKALHPFDIGGIAETLGITSKGNKKWYNVTFEIVTATVGVGAFALPETVGVDGIVVYTCIFLVLTLLNFISCSYWNEHKVLWNAQADKDPKLDRMVTYEDWGKVAFGNMGLMMQTAIQLGYYVLLCVVFVKLLDENISAVLLRNVGGFEPFEVTTASVFDPKLLAKEMNEKGTLQIRLNTPKCIAASENKTDQVEATEADLKYFVRQNKVLQKTVMPVGDLSCVFQVSSDDLGNFEETGTGETKAATWTRLPGLFGHVEDGFTVEGKSSFKVMHGLDEVILPIDYKTMRFESGKSTNQMKLLSKVLTVALQVGFTIMYERADKFVFGNGFFGICGVVGVFVSWAMIIIHIAFQFIGVWGGDTEYAEYDFWMPEQTTARSAFTVANDWSYISATAFGAWAMIGLVPSMSQQMEKPREFGKTLISSYLICGIIYYLPVFIYMLNGKEKKVLDMMSFQSENTRVVVMTWMLRLGVIMNMIASYAVTLYPPATTTESVVAKKVFGADEPNFMVKVAVRGVFSFFVVALAFGMGGTFGKVFTIISATFVPISTGIAPFLYDLKLKWEVAKLEGDKSTLSTYLMKRFFGEGPKATAKMLFMSFGAVVAVITIPFGIMYGVTGVAESWKLPGLKNAVDALEALKVQALKVQVPVGVTPAPAAF